MLPKSCREFHRRKKIRGLLSPFYSRRSGSIYLINVTVLLIFTSSLNLVNSSSISITETNSALEDATESYTTDSSVASDGNKEVEYLSLKETPPPSPPSIRFSLVDSGVVKEVISDSFNTTVVIPVGKYGLTEEQDVPKRVLRFECSGTYPVEWIYEGAGVPFNTQTRSFRHVHNYSDPETWTFSAYIDITKNEEKNTGRYICQPIQTNLTQQVYYQLYIPGEKFFLSIPKKTLRLWDNNTELIIPCPSSHPNMDSSVKLYKKIGMNVSPVSFPSTYHPTKGFTIKLDESIPVKDYRGTYFCKDVFGRISPSYKVLPPIGSFVKVTPETNYVRIIPGQKQFFKCEAKENVTLTWSGDRQPRVVDFEVNPSSEYPFIAFFEINPTNMSAEHTVINCVTGHDEVLYTWEYSTYEDVSISKFYFDGHKRYQDARYICCSESFYKPKFEYIFCRTETECALKKRILDEDPETKEQALGEYSNRISPLNSTCILFNPYLKYTLPTGLLRCSVNGISRSLHRDFMYYFNPYRIYQAYTDDKFDAEKVGSSESIMKVSKTPARNTLVGQMQRFLCYYSEMFFSNGIIWELEWRNGTKDFLKIPYDDMKSNVSFSQVELTFNDTDVKAINCYAPVKASPTVWRRVSGPLFVRERPTIRAFVQTEEGVILKQLSDNISSNIILDSGAFNTYENSIQGDSILKAELILECNASYPVDFLYSGEGTPKIDFLPHRFGGSDLQNASEYAYSARIKVLKVDQQIIGKYSCVSATREFAHKGKEENLRSNLKLFVPGNNLFINPDNQTFRAWDYRDSLLIPCTVTDPRPIISLLKLNNQTNEWESLSENSTLEYDPLQGFSLNKNHTNALHGYYKCVGDGNRTSGVIQVYLPSGSVRVTPYIKEVKVRHNETQSFTCESKENVTLIFSDDLEGTTRVIQSKTNFSTHYPYVVSYETKLDEFSNLTLINCTTTKDNKSLHTWELYPKDGQFIDQFYYDNKTEEMKCCTKPYRSPTIEWTNCTSITECYMKQSACLLQNKCSPGDFVLTEGVDKANMVNGCLAMSVTGRSHGLLKCTVKGIHKIVAQALVYFSNTEKNFEIHDGYFLGPKIFDKFDVKNDIIMNLASSVEGTINLGEKNVFDCTGSKFFVSSGVKWALEGKNGTLKYMDGKDLTNYQQVHSQVEIVFEDADWATLYCIAPNWKEYYGWRNISIPLVFDIDTITTTNLPTTEETEG